MRHELKTFMLTFTVLAVIYLLIAYEIIWGF